MLNYFNAYVLYPLLEKKAKRKVFEKVRLIKNFEKLPYDEQNSLRAQYLYNILAFCRNKIPFYTNLFEKLNFDIEKVKTDITYLENLPILTKEDVRKAGDSLKPLDKRYLHSRKTGGSTGQSVMFYYDTKGLDWSAAINICAHEMAGRKLHHTDLQIGADFSDQKKMKFKERLIQKIKFSAQNRAHLPVSSFSDESLGENYRYFKKRRPFLIQGHPSTLYAIAEYIERNKLEKIKLCEVFEPSGEMLTHKIVDSIERNIGCRVVNRYGNAEFGVVAHSQPSDSWNKLRVFNRAFYVEECEKSALIVTGLTNTGFPLLRYDTGDVATVKNENDGTYIYDIQGRIHDCVEINKEVFPTHFIMDVLDHRVGGIKEFQVILSDEDEFPQLNIIPESEDDKERIYKLLKERWPVGLDVNFINHNSLHLQGWRQKFRHLVDLREKNESNF